MGENRDHAQTGAVYFPNDERAAEQFDALAEQLGGPESIRPQDGILIADIVRNERIKEKLRADIETRGLGIMERNGRQSYWRENKSVSLLMKISDQQRRTMQALGLIAKLHEKDQPADNDDGDFDQF